jgi:hypothetical protein
LVATTKKCRRIVSRGETKRFAVRTVSRWNHYERRINDFAELFVFKDLAGFSFRVFPWGCDLAEKRLGARWGIPSCCAFGSDPLGGGRTLRAALCASFLTCHAVARDWQSCVGVMKDKRPAAKNEEGPGAREGSARFEIWTSAVTQSDMIADNSE